MGSDNGIVPDKQQAIIWTNNGSVWWHIYVSLCLSELIACKSTMFMSCWVTNSIEVFFESSFFFHFVDFFPLMHHWNGKCNIFFHLFNSSPPEQNVSHFADDIFKYIFLNENVWISIKISLKFVPKGPINNIAALVQMMAWRWPGDKPWSEPMMVRLPTHICVSRPQWVKALLSQRCNTRHFKVSTKRWNKQWPIFN